MTLNTAKEIIRDDVLQPLLRMDLRALRALINTSALSKETMREVGGTAAGESRLFPRSRARPPGKEHLGVDVKLG